MKCVGGRDDVRFDDDLKRDGFVGFWSEKIRWKAGCVDGGGTV